MSWANGIPAPEYADAGATWLLRSQWPQVEGWQERLADIIDTGPAV